MEEEKEETARIKINVATDSHLSLYFL